MINPLINVSRELTTVGLARSGLELPVYPVFLKRLCQAFHPCMLKHENLVMLHQQYLCYCDDWSLSLVASSFVDRLALGASR